ncbi:MAG: hypothetical protein OEZ38_10545, partial [Gammaproteobacteria bacterium]|nr:hypothetical protein [Gammaproteobacteria bacterium]
PVINYDEDQLAQRFGEASLQENINETTEKFHYPDLGLLILLDTNGPEQFIYSYPETETTPEN